jgi:hypothetical protein
VRAVPVDVDVGAGLGVGVTVRIDVASWTEGAVFVTPGATGGASVGLELYSADAEFHRAPAGPWLVP